MRCPACGEDNEEGRKFCLACGSPLALVCSACGSGNNPRARFCGECGAALAGAAGAAPALRAPAALSGSPAPAAERRLVSVLFADLVGFTAASESRDPEQVRELLSRYFDLGRRLVELYGGTLEKFIGDALMAVWGTPVANEDDAERAVRASLELVRAIEQLGEEAGLPGLRARAAVMSGEAAVTVGAVGQGMVAGDLVNTASRMQSLAPPGAVLVSDATRRLTEAAIVYEDAGAHEVKGKSEPLQAWTAQRVVAARGGSQRTSGLEPPFLGRDRELRLLKEVFHACAEEGRAQLVSVNGIAGIGKSRVSWEFLKYIDGLVMNVLYHAGRCLAYGEGVTYWALAEMVRRRAGILESDARDAAAEKLRACLEQHFADEEERRWLEPRLAVLIGIGEAPNSERQDLFAAWRRFFERLAEQSPTVLVFEDMQWADPSLLDFIDYLLDWSRGHALCVVALGRPGGGRRALAGGRSHTELHLEALPQDVMQTLIAELVPGLEAEVVGRIVQRSEGVPLYAVETVRMLLDRGLLAEEGSTYRLTAPLQGLDVPESLHGLITARLDGLEPIEKKLVQDAAVLGKTFTAEGLAYLAGQDRATVEAALTGLVRKDVLALQADPRSPERGMYGFVQDLVREVAYEMLGRHDRRERHLRVAEYLSRDQDPEVDIAEVLAAHYEAAYQAAPDAADAAAIKAKARDMYSRAGDRAANLGAPEEAQGFFERALEVAEDAELAARLHWSSGQMALRRGLLEDSIHHFEEARRLYESAGRRDQAALATGNLADALFFLSRLAEAIQRVQQALELLGDPQSHRAERAALAAQIGRLLVLSGQDAAGLPYIEEALGLAEEQQRLDVFAGALMTKGVAYMNRNRPEEALTLTQKALQVAEDVGDHQGTFRALTNLQAMLYARGRLQETIELNERLLTTARRLGDRFQEIAGLTSCLVALYRLGEWDAALSRADLAQELAAGRADTQWGAGEVVSVTSVLVARGRLKEARALVESLSGMATSEDYQMRSLHLGSRSALLRAEGRHRESLEAVEEWLAQGGPDQFFLAEFLEQGVDAAVEIPDVESARRLLDRFAALTPVELTAFARAARERARAKVHAAAGDGEGVEDGFRTAAALFTEMGWPFHQASTQLELAEWLTGQGREDEAQQPLAEARVIFERLGAVPWLERAARLRVRQDAVTA